MLKKPPGLRRPATHTFEFRRGNDLLASYFGKQQELKSSIPNKIPQTQTSNFDLLNIVQLNKTQTQTQLLKKTHFIHIVWKFLHSVAPTTGSFASSFSD